MERNVSVTLPEMLAAREARQRRIEEALARGEAPLVSFSMNIPGPVKDSSLIRRAFAEGCRRLEEGLAGRGFSFTLRESIECATGCEALYAVRFDALAVKALCAEIEDRDEVGRLFDMDVIDPAGRRLERTQLGLDARGCMVCGAAGRGCASRRRHSVEELQRETDRRLRCCAAAAVRDEAAALATQSLLDEVNVTPKPGLVDRANNGSHRDMDLRLFEVSAAALSPYWGQCVDIGRESAQRPSGETFPLLREAGLAAERAMLAATGGVNTHKGAVFLLGVVCGAIGRLWDGSTPRPDVAEILEECARMTAAPMAAEFARIEEQGIEKAATAGARLYLRHALRGARGEAAQGFPGVRDALPVLKHALAAGLSREHAAAIALLRLIARGTDTNMFHRGGEDGARWGAQAAGQLLERSPAPTFEQISELDRQFIEKNLSPGGCADLLALTLFLHSWEERGKIPFSICAAK